MTFSQVVVVQTAKRYAARILAGEALPPKELRLAKLSLRRVLDYAVDDPAPDSVLEPLRLALDEVTGSLPLRAAAGGAP